MDPLLVGTSSPQTLVVGSWQAFEELQYHNIMFFFLALEPMVLLTSDVG